MALVKFLLYILLSTIIVFFVWNMLKRIFFTKFYNFFPHQKERNEQHQKMEKNSNKTNGKGLNWDAETVDYEELK